MDEKTAAIPSLKEFKEQQKERSAHTSRSESMQTKDQMRRSQERQQKKTSAKTPAKGSAKSPSRPSAASKGKAPAGKKVTSDKGNTAHRTVRTDLQQTASFAQRRPADSQRRTYRQENPASESQRRKSQPAPHTYARQRNAQESGRGVSTSKDATRAPKSEGSARRTGETLRTNTKRPAPAGSRKNSKKANKPMSPAMRKFRNFLVYLSIILIVFIVGGILSLTVLFKTNNINVNGLNGMYQEQEIIEASGLTTGINIFTAPKARAEDRIESKFPYIESADISSSFPDTINIDITIATPACVIEGLGGYYIVSDKGKVLEVSATDDEANVPIIEGEGIGKQSRAQGEFIEFESELVRTALQDIFAAFKEYDCKNITAINIKAEEGSFAIKYVYDNRIVVFLGLPEHINYKIQTADKIIKEKLELGGTMVAGDLDVSMCHDTMKSYFNQYTLLAPQVAPSADSTKPVTATEESPTEEYIEDEYYDESDDYYDDGYDDGYYDEAEDAWYPEEDYYEYEDDYYYESQE